MFKKISKAILPVAGMGTRLLPATKAIPKEMLPIINKPLIQYAVEEAISSGITEIIFITNHNERIIRSHFETVSILEENLRISGKDQLLHFVRNIIPSHVKCTYVQQEYPYGLGDAILRAAYLIDNEPFSVLLADDLIDYQPNPPVLKQLIDIAIKKQANVIGVEEVSHTDVKKYGIVSSEKINEKIEKVLDISEKPEPESAPSNLAVVGRYVLQPEAISHLRSVAPSLNNEIQLTDGLVSLAKEMDIFAYHYLGTRYDCGSKNGVFKATISLGIKYHGFKSPTELELSSLIKRNII